MRHNNNNTIIYNKQHTHRNSTMSPNLTYDSRLNSRSFNNTTYNYDSLARVPVVQPDDRYRNTKRNATSKPINRPQLRPSRVANQGVMSVTYVLFLTAMSLFIGFTCVTYLSVSGSVSAKRSELSELQQHVANLKIENDFQISLIQQDVNMEDVRARATELGMVFMDDSQVINYDSPINDSIVQHNPIPSDGILSGF